MKGVLRWLLGSEFGFMPEEVRQEFEKQKPPPDGTGNFDIIHGTTLDPTRGDGFALDQDHKDAWLPMLKYQEMVKFINEAIEWENVLYFLYSYFWDILPSWNFIR
jgi:hypothetical protein